MTVTYYGNQTVCADRPQQSLWLAFAPRLEIGGSQHDFGRIEVGKFRRAIVPKKQSQISNLKSLISNLKLQVL
ncbi:MAG: hypothetical protein ACRC62_07500 [Microcoleus sp.]